MLLESQGQPVASMDFGPLIHLDPSGVAAPLPRRAGVCASTLRAMQVTLPHPPTHVVMSPQPPASAPATCRATGTPLALGARWAPAIEGHPRPATCVAYAYTSMRISGHTHTHIHAHYALSTVRTEQQLQSTFWGASGGCVSWIPSLGLSDMHVAYSLGSV